MVAYLTSLLCQFCTFCQSLFEFYIWTITALGVITHPCHLYNLSTLTSTYNPKTYREWLDKDVQFRTDGSKSLTLCTFQLKALVLISRYYKKILCWVLSDRASWSAETATCSYFIPMFLRQNNSSKVSHENGQIVISNFVNYFTMYHRLASKCYAPAIAYLVLYNMHMAHIPGFSTHFKVDSIKYRVLIFPLFQH